MGACYHADWTTSMTKTGWSRCGPKFFVAGFYRSSCQSLYCIEKAKCCRVSSSTWDKCKTVSWAPQMEQKGWAYAGGADFIVGFMRSGEKAKVGSNGLSNIKAINQCNFKP